jgi:hypothetical protein
MNGVFLDAGDYIVVLWRLKGLEANSGRTLDSPVVSIYKMRDEKIIESQRTIPELGGRQNEWLLTINRLFLGGAHLNVAICGFCLL